MTDDSLNARLAEISGQLGSALPAEALGVLFEEQRRLGEEGRTPALVKPGDVLPTATLTGPDGVPVDLAEALGDGPAVVVFYRGGWCPYCNLTLRTYQQELLPHLGEFGATLVAVSPQAYDGSLDTKGAAGLEYAVLSDIGNTLARELGITHAVSEEVRRTQTGLGLDLGEVNGTGRWELPHPTVLVVSADRTVLLADVHPDFSTRTEVSTVLEALRSER
ncbi:peroxiredoxin-like family protein [Streptomyces sp. NPDC090741]|uniref:peroxiredoxin-like family protein n=1 Tax=Streptomyces sp. NPDC090741 TaxID=3365967 RepID=UPI0038215FF9